MKRIPLYSSSQPSPAANAAIKRQRPGIKGEKRRAAGTDTQGSRADDAVGELPPAPATRIGRLRASWRRFSFRHERLLTVATSVLVTLLLIAGYTSYRPGSRALAQEDIDGAVLHTLENNVLPSPEVKAYEGIQGSVVRVRGQWAGGTDEWGNDKDALPTMGIGTGVVIVDKGIILTNLHVVQGFEKVHVTFADGLESEAIIIGTRPEHDLAVLQAKTIPDDLSAATMRSTQDLAVGDRVIAVGFPFGIGPSLSSGVVSGLRREYQSPEGKRLLTNLIQFDAAVNPGNSGGPLVTANGEVVGIVTGLLNPNEQRVFIGIGLAVPIENAALAIGMPPF